MPIFFNKAQRGNPANPDAPKKWYLVLKSLGLVKEKQVAQQIADETTLNPKEAEIALSQLRKVVVNNLLSGHTVQLGDWGSFQLTVNSTGTDTKEELSANNAVKINIRFIPGKALISEINQKAQLRPVEGLNPQSK